MILSFVVFGCLAWTSCSAFDLVTGVGGGKAWYDHLPNENLTGVPKRILDNEQYYPAFKDLWLSIIGKTGNNERVIKEARKRQKVQKIIDDNVPFPCDLSLARSPEKPSSVHTLRPGDIDVVAALGDSLTAGNGALALSTQHVMVENRGLAALIGGQATWRKFLTLPNILKEFNPKLIGYALGDSFTHHRESQFDIAEIGAMSQDLPFMTRQLVKRIKKDRRVDFQNDWKLITVLMGSNNFCIDICYLPNALTSIEEHKGHLIKSLEFLRDNMPRTIVSLVQSPNLKALVNFEYFPPVCELLHKFECPCLFTLQHKPRYQEYVQTMDGWQRVEEEVANDERFKTKEDFAVVLQQFTKNITFPPKRQPNGQVLTDLTYLSDDCFHFSQKGYSRASNALWNNMLEPVGAKSINWNTEFAKFLCPTQSSPYIRTWRNS
ncbi:phospholipase B1, membrane-associated-like [Planococcus citri]|uniref:phospholipase B1, membrane-associated-like n=1 Tax=Planococcus citri TaxID=170843 RepID=UPI0031F77CB8